MRRAWDRTGGLPQLVTENGIGTADDTRRIASVEEAWAGSRAPTGCRDEVALRWASVASETWT
jgi:beta-glucosidase